MFDDAIVEGRGHLAAFEWLESNTGGYHFDGSQPSHVQWELVEVPSRGNVLEVTFNGNDPDDLAGDNGWFGITAGTDETIAMDLSAFANGAVAFDMRILQQGANADMLDFKMECGYPCTSEEFWLADPAELGEWQSYEISIQALIETGLDITKVTNLFVFKPTWGWQHGQYVIQLDNIELKKTYTSNIELPEAPKTRLQTIYYQNGLADNSGYGVAGSSILSEQTEAGSRYIDALFFEDGPAAEFWVYTNLQSDMTNYFYGEIVFDLRVVNYGGNPGEFTVNSFCGWPCRAIPRYSLGRPVEGIWQTHRIPVRTLAENGLQLHRVVNPLVLQFNGPTREGLEINLNNIRWEYTPPTE
ncbi:putative glycoside hydrolase [Saccharophagus sp. K07]|uniref:putative glycoside hydrolase n=1 Tax=Saccharophagus sp. K07 TaxID=2283636 RepID=UPI001652520E|nr:putative glycoside hydrolase [Saccharophagus sp. K07]